MKIKVSLSGMVSLSGNKDSLQKINGFLQALGVAEFLTANKAPKLSKNKRTWTVSLTDDGPIYDLLSDKLGDPFGDNGDEGTLIWIINGKGVVTYSEDDCEMTVSVLEAKDKPTLAVTIADSDNDTRYKNYEINNKKKVITYQCYDHSGTRDAKAVLRSTLKRLGLKDWRVVMEEGHWGAD